MRVLRLCGRALAKRNATPTLTLPLSTWGGEKSWVAALVVMSFLWAGAPCGLAQAMLQIAGSPDTPQATGFSVHKPPPDVMETLEDFERFRDKQAWEKALAALDKVYDAAPTGLIPSPDGFLLPVGQKLRQEMLSLPPAGREAFRLFNDPKAQALYQAAVDSAGDDSGAAVENSPDSIAALQGIVDRYFVSSIGDKAADRLGDALFEAGNFAGAQQAWKMILDDYPDTTLAPALLQTKRAIALAREGKWEEFGQVRAIVHDRYAGQSVTLGGSETAADQYLDALAAAKSGGPTTQPSSMTPSTVADSVAGDDAVALPKSDTPVWQIPLMDDATEKQVEQALSQYGWQSMGASITSRSPAVASDGKRLYVNGVGACFAADLVTGKMVWRTDVISNLGQVVKQSFMYGGGLDFADTAVAVCGDNLYLVRRPRSEVNAGPGNPEDRVMRLFCLKAASGKEIWKSTDGPLSAWSFLGHLLVSGNTLYVCARAPQSQEIHLLSIAPDDQVNFDLTLGTGVGGTDMRGQPTVRIPEMIEHDGKIFILTNCGIVLAVDPQGPTILWAFSYPTRVANAQQQFFVSNAVASDPPGHGAIVVRGSTLCFKEEGDDVLYALDLAGQSLLWKRPTDETVALSGADDSGVLMLGPEADRIDATSHALLWSDRLSGGAADIRPVFQGGHAYVFGSRGVHDLNAATGDVGPVFHGYDRSGMGGEIWFTGGDMVTVSSRAITAYPLGKQGQP